MPRRAMLQKKTQNLNEEYNDDHRLVEETKEYYRKRASQYFDWSRVTDEYEGDSPPDPSFFDETKILLQAVDSAGLGGNILEIACGPGVWTEAVVKNAASVTALDSSKAMIERNRLRLKGNAKVSYVEADFYDWTPDVAYDAVTFAFWISHVPGSRLDEVVSKVSWCLKPKGRVFFVDQQDTGKKDELLDRPDGEIATRTLNDGTTFRIIKHFYSPDEIREAFLRNGIWTHIANTPTHFYIVSGTKSL